MSAAGHLELSFELGGLDGETVAEAAGACGAIAVSFADAADDPVLEPLPGEFRLWPRTRVQCLFEMPPDQLTLQARLADAVGIDAPHILARTVAPRAWEREWLKDFHALRFGRRLWVCPRHEQVLEPHAVVVQLDPGLAFGTGTHPSTALCLTWLDAHADLLRAPAGHDNHAPEGARVIDYGCGSGVLALAAAKLGAAAVHCFDIDPQALLATTENSAANGTRERVHVHASAAQLPPDNDVLLANILSGPLRALAPQFAQWVRPHGQVVLAGLMQEEVTQVTAAYAPWFDVECYGRRDSWICLAGPRRSV